MTADIGRKCRDLDPATIEGAVAIAKITAHVSTREGHARKAELIGEMHAQQDVFILGLIVAGPHGRIALHTGKAGAD